MTDANLLQATVIRKLIAGQAVPMLADTPEPWGTIRAAIDRCPAIPSERTKAFDAALAELDPFQAEAIRAAVHAIDPTAPLPPNLLNHKTRWTAGELLAADFPAPLWAVPNTIPEGLTFLAGRPKLGKSWLALQIAHAVATGGMVLGERVKQGRVLYIALEDSPRRLKERMQKQGVPDTDQITFITRWKPFPEGGLVDLQNEITAGGYVLVIIDTLSRAIGRADQLDPAEMTLYIGNLQHLSINSNLAILLIDHHRKPGGFDTSPIDDILGSTAKAAAADGALGLYRLPGKREYTLKITGRDMEERELALAWDAELCCWQSLGNAEDVRENSLKGEVIQAIKSLIEDGELATTRRIAQRIDKKDSNVSHAISELIATGKVRRGEAKGREKPYELL